MNLAFLDLEFHRKGIKQKGYQIIRISIVKTDMFFNIKEEYDTLVKAKINEWNKDIEVERITGINLTKLHLTGAYFQNVAKYLEVFLKDVSYIITWGNLDEPILKDNYAYRGIKSKEIYSTPFIDAQRCHMKIKGLNNNMSLKKASEDINYYINHNSLHDVYRLISVCRNIGIHNIIIEHYNILKEKGNKMFNAQSYTMCCHHCGEKVTTLISDDKYLKKNGNMIRRSLLKCKFCDGKNVLSVIISNSGNVSYHEYASSNNKYFETLNEIILDKNYKF